METITIYSVSSGILTLIIIITGIWLKKTGEPYKTVIFNIHKLAVVALTVFIVLIFLHHVEKPKFKEAASFMFGLSGVVYLITFVSGALLSFKKIIKHPWQRVHLAGSVILTVLGLLIWMFFH